MRATTAKARKTCVLDLAAPIPPIDPSKGAKGQRSGISWTRWITADFPSRMFCSTPSAVGVVVPGRIDVDIPWICMSLSAPKGQRHTRQRPRPPPTTTSATTYHVHNTPSVVPTKIRSRPRLPITVRRRRLAMARCPPKIRKHGKLQAPSSKLP